MSPENRQSPSSHFRHSRYLRMMSPPSFRAELASNLEVRIAVYGPRLSSPPWIKTAGFRAYVQIDDLSLLVLHFGGL